MAASASSASGPRSSAISGGPLEGLDGVFHSAAAGEVLDEPVGAEEEAVLVPGPAVDEAVGAGTRRSVFTTAA
ncbi:MAG: hypothetical protein M3R38_17780, partial [Actinomycetota bacterium]|nr:hypothetical protein [Actinomycetota bacterium]